MSKVTHTPERSGPIVETRDAVVLAARRYRAAVLAWHAADDRLDDLKKPSTKAQRRAWLAANRVCTDAEHKMCTTEKALFRAVDRLTKSEARR